MLADNELLRCYCADRSESAFAELVKRHADLVYSAALHHLNGNPDLARDVTQVVFTDLALKAASLRLQGSLAGWLYTSARFAAAKLIRSEQRRQAREEKALVMDNPEIAPGSTGDDPAGLRPIIHDAMQELDEADREAVLLRYFEGQDYRSVGTALGLSDDTARKRVVRAVERLRAILKQRGISSSESALLAALTGAAALSTPADLHASVIRSAMGVSVSSTTRIPSTLFRITSMKTAILLTGLVVGLGTSTILQRDSTLRLRTDNESMAKKLVEAQTEQAEWRAGQSALGEELARLRKDQSELLRLRDEVTRLRSAHRDEARLREGRRETDDQMLVNQQVAIEAKFVVLASSVLKKTALEAIGIDISGGGVSAILTAPQLRTLVRAFEQQTRVDILAAPTVTTLHNRQASVEIVGTSNPDAEDTKLGPSLDVLPVVSADRMTISLQTTARLAELASIRDDSGAEHKQLRQTAVSGNSVIKDGQTTVLCQWVGRVDAGGTAPVQDPTFMVVLVTSTLIDPAGNRIHSAEEIPAEDAATGVSQGVGADSSSPSTAR
jgi:RNA polymerase sigma factor (sigma-70 family)